MYGLITVIHVSTNRTQPKPQQLLVEGKNYRHVIWAWCQQYQLPETFSVEVPQEEGTEGVEALLSCRAFKLYIQGGRDTPQEFKVF
jgi:hypothetical protein